MSLTQSSNIFCCSGLMRMLPLANMLIMLRLTPVAALICAKL